MRNGAIEYRDERPVGIPECSYKQIPVGGVVRFRCVLIISGHSHDSHATQVCPRVKPERIVLEAPEDIGR